jgi:hypothetical protein
LSPQISRRLGTISGVTAELCADQARPRGYDWANAGARLAIPAPLPAATTFLLVADGARSDWWGLFAILAWVGWFMVLFTLGLHAWWGEVDDSTVQVSSRELGGRTGWPIRRWRSVSLDQLASVRYVHEYFKLHVDSLIVVRDRTGGRLVLRFSGHTREGPRHNNLCKALLRALDRSPQAKAGFVTRRRLRGGNPAWTVPHGLLWYMVSIAAPTVLALIIVNGLGFDLGPPAR